MPFGGKRKPKAAPRSSMVHVRLHDPEAAALKALAENLGQSPSRIIRRLIREAITGGPDYFKDELVELSRMSRELAAIGRNLNQLSRAANRGEAVSGPAVRRVVNASMVQMEGVKRLYDQALETVAQRAVVPLREEAGPEEARACDTPTTTA